MILRGIQNYLRLALALVVLTCVHRILILNLDIAYNFSAVYFGATSKVALVQAWWLQYQPAVTSGLMADFVFVLCASLLAFVISPRWMILPLVLLSIFYAANIEHLHYNFSHIQLGTIYMALDPTFVAGSGLTRDMLLNTSTLAAIAFVVYRATRFVAARAISAVAVVAMLAAVIITPQTINPLDPGWMQTHPLAFSFPQGGAAEEGADFAMDALDSRATITPAPSDAPNNVLVVYLEGVSQYSLTTGDMPFLQGLAKQNLSFDRYFGNQLQTNNGLYTTLTGYYPNFLGVNSPWDTLHADDPAAQTSLPTVLASQGYHTAFLQSAEISFMNKAEHMAQLGFQTVKGREAWSAFHAQNGWGIDDLGLFEGALGYIDTLPQDAPWFVSLLTSGTHAPYNVPAKFLPDASPRLRALKYADAAAQSLVAGLKARGLLENTVVIFTADESREPGGKSNLENEILLNWLPLIVMHPNGKGGTVDWPMGATNFRDLVLRVAGDWDRADIDAFDQPDTPLIFGNHYKSRVFWFDRTRGEFFACYTQKFLCAKFEWVTDLTQLGGLTPAMVSTEPRMRTIFEAHETPR